MEVTKAMRPAPPSLVSAIQRAACWVRKWGPLRFVEISSSKLSSVASSRSRRSRGALEGLAGEGEQRGAILAARNVALEDLAAGLLAQGIGGVLTAAPSGNHPVSLGQLRGDGAADSTAAAGDNRCRLIHDSRV